MSQRQHRQEDAHFWVMRLLEEKPDLSQRELARELGVSLGAINYCLQALVEKGWIKIRNFSHSRNKLGYVYLLTPQGVAEKTDLASRFLKRKMQEYEMLRTEIEALQRDLRHKEEGSKLL